MRATIHARRRILFRLASTFRWPIFKCDWGPVRYRRVQNGAGLPASSPQARV